MGFSPLVHQRIPIPARPQFRRRAPPDIPPAVATLPPPAAPRRGPWFQPRHIRFQQFLRASRAHPQGVSSYYTEGVGSYYAAGSPPLPGRWKTLGLGQSDLLTPEQEAELYRNFPSGGAYGTGYPSAEEIAAAQALVAQPAGSPSYIAAGSPPAPNAQVVAAGVPSTGVSDWLNKSTTLLGTSVKNSYLAAAGALGAFIIFGMKKRGR